MQFKVPQFLDIEDKIFGPFTFREFVYLAGGAGMCFVLYKLLGLLWGAIPILAVAGFALALIFYKPNNKPFLNLLESMFTYLIQDKLFIWKRHRDTTKNPFEDGGQNRPREEKPVLPSRENISRLTGSKLRDLAWSLDVLDLKK